MSTVDRKIAFYNFEYKAYRTYQKYFNKEHFIEVMNNLSSINHIMDISRSNKAVSIERVFYELIDFQDVFKVTLKSCKYNHSPDYMSSIDGSIRDTDKKIYEGEKEITHLCINVKNVEAEVILEERRSGVTINEVTNFLNQCMRLYNGQTETPNNYKLIYGLVPSVDFLTSLETMQEVKVAEIYEHKRILGSETMGLLDREDHSMKDEVIIKINAKRGESLLKRNFGRIYEQIVGEETEVTRIRIYGNDESNMSIKLDSDVMKRLEYVKADLDDNGVVNSNDVLEKMIELLGVNTNEEM